jgi:hypothetical protein
MIDVTCALTINLCFATYISMFDDWPQAFFKLMRHHLRLITNR